MKKKLSQNLNAQLKTYSIAAGAVVIASSNINATIHHTNLGDGVVIDRTNDTFAIDFGNDGSTNFIINLEFTGSTALPYTLQIQPQTASAFVFSTGFSHNAQVLSFGDEVNNPSANWMNKSYTGILGARKTTFSGATTSYGSFHHTTNKYIGVQFKLNGNVNYGWVQVNVPGNPSYSIITGYAYNNEDDGNITAGQVPEAGSLALLALGAIGLKAWRKQRF